MYVELHASSAFSFLDGASLPERLAERAAALGYDSLALIDRDGVYGAPRFHHAATQLGVLPQPGSVGQKALMLIRGFGLRATS